MNINPTLLADVVGQIDTASTLNARNTLPNDLGKDAFLRLLVAQLKHQNPLEPVNNQEFLAQMAQFSALEQMQNLNKNFEAVALMDFASQASTFLGREIEAVGTISEEKITGIVSSVKFVDGTAMLLVDGQEIPVSAVQKISIASQDLP
jgi:flagellar basal-body rod modification protein FlgD